MRTLMYRRALSVRHISRFLHHAPPGSNAHGGQVPGWIACVAAMGACGALLESDAWSWTDLNPLAIAHAHSNEPQSLEAWLSSRGCTFKHCEVTPSAVAPRLLRLSIANGTHPSTSLARCPSGATHISQSRSCPPHHPHTAIPPPAVRLNGHPSRPQRAPREHLAPTPTPHLTCTEPACC
jgi:hypothetical protein